MNRQIKEKRPVLSAQELCSIFLSGDLLEIGFLSKQCKNDLCGSCLMCDYGYMRQMGVADEYIKEMKTILAKNTDGIDYLLLCTNGSFFDSYQISDEILIAILMEAQKCPIPNIIIETHYKDVTKEKLDIVNQIIHKPVTIEMGLETINQKYQDVFFMKGISIKEYLSTISLIKEYNYNVDLNIMLGLPLLSPNQQIKDTIDTIEWAVQHGCIPVLFPINIKYYTFLRYLYDTKIYEPIPLWMVIMVLNKISDKALENIVVAWYGNRDESYADNTPNIMPQTCPICGDLLTGFISDLHRTNDVSKRKQLISELLRKSTCKCLTALYDSQNQSDCNFDHNFQCLLESLNTIDMSNGKGDING